MKSIKVVIIIFLLQFTSSALSSSKEVIVIAAFGTSYKVALPAYHNVDRLVKKQFPGIPVKWCYTSSFIRKKLKKKGEIFLSPEELLEQLHAEGYTRVTLQSLHIIPGSEYEEIRTASEKFKNKFSSIEVGRPLLGGYGDAERVAKTIVKLVPIKKNVSLVLMGHGSHHQATMYYVAMDSIFKKLNSNIHMGTVEGYPSFEDAVNYLKGSKQVKLLPFMVVAGDHARNDMGGDDEDSWKTKLKKRGIEALPIFKGLAEFDEIAQVFVDHINDARKQ